MEEKIQFDEPVNRKGTDCLKYDFAARRGKPEDVLPLWVADMDFKTSDAIIEAIQKRAAHGIFGYTETDERYYQTVAGWFGKHYQMTIERNWLVKTPGVVFALAMAVRAYTEKGDAVLIQQPVYYPFSEVIVDNGRKLVSSDLVLGEDGKYRMDFEDFEKKIQEHQVKLFLFCSPHNPVGRVWTREEQEQIAEICFKHQVIVVSDEIHEDFTFEGYMHIPFANIDKRMQDFCVTATSPAKTFNLAGLQISNIIIPNGKLRHAFKKEIASSGYSQCNTMGIVACEAAYAYGEAWYLELKKYLQSNLDFVREYIQNELPEITMIEPEGTYLIWLDFRKLGLSGAKLEDLIVHKAHLWLDSGAIFGKSGEGFERINIATSRQVLQQALNQLKEALHSQRRI